LYLPPDFLPPDFQGGLDALCSLRFQGDPGSLSHAQVERLKAFVATGRFLAARQVADWVAETFRVAYTDSGMRNLLHRIGVSYHKATGFLWKADPDKQEEFLKTHRRQKQQADGRRTRRYFVDGCHPVWGVEVLYYCWLLVGQRFLVGVGGGRKRLNILGASWEGSDDIDRFQSTAAASVNRDDGLEVRQSTGPHGRLSNNCFDSVTPGAKMGVIRRVGGFPA
jgi:hypothetical protein